MDFEKERREWEEAAALTPLLEGVVFEGVKAGTVHCEWVRAEDADRTKVLLYAHGGGFTAGSSVTHRDLASRLSVASKIPVLLVDYRLAPEHPFPAGLEDIIYIFRCLIATGYRAENVAIGGDSAGGNLALSALLSLRDNVSPLPAALVLLSPWLDLTLTGESIVSREARDGITTKVELLRARGYYIGSHDGSDRLVSPLFADLHGLPPTLVHAGNEELLLSDSERLVEKAGAAGVDVTLKVWPGMSHVFHGDASTVPLAQQAINEIGVFLAQKLS